MLDPSHVRHQTGVYLKAFLSLKQKFRQDRSKVFRWMKAMTDLSGLAGWDVRNKPESEEIEDIVHEVIKTLDHKFSGPVDDDIIGMQPRVATLESILELNSEEEDNFRVLGIWGMSGIGKTTLATALYNRISYQFDACCFIDDVSNHYREGGATAVQKLILCQTLKDEDLDKCSPPEISRIVRNRLPNIKVLIVLDNVDKVEQLQNLAINPELLHAGSRMIVITRDKHILTAYKKRELYEAQLMKGNDARQLLCRKAFKSDDSKSNSIYEELITEILKYAKGLPLVISVVGTFLCDQDAPQWIDALDRLKNNPDKDIIDVLRLSFDGLQHDEKEIFLHIACFFKGEREDYVKRILDACRLYPVTGIRRLIETSLIMIKNKKIHMHEMLQELGKHIVSHQFPRKPWSWSRLWSHLDFHSVLMRNKETDKVEAIVLDEKDVAECSQTSASAEGLSKMTGLTLLILNHKNFSGNLDSLSCHLQYLMWHGYPFTSLPSNFEPYGLVELNMRNSSIQRLWDGRKDLPSLKRIDLGNSKYLTETPVFDGTPNLEWLDLTGCTNLRHVHQSIGILSKLAFLSLQNCSSLVVLDFGSDCNLSSMRVLELSGCTKLEKMRDFTKASNLEYLDIDQCTSLSVVHESIGTRTKIRFLSCRDCTSLVSIPYQVYAMQSLITLDFHGCFKLRKLPPQWSFSFSIVPALILLDLGFCNLSEVSDGIGQMNCLERLNLERNNFVSLPSTIGRLERLAYLNLAHCHELQSLPELLGPKARYSSVGSYFQTASGSRDHRSGLYIFDCPKLAGARFWDSAFRWLRCLIEEPRHFRCGFDIVIPWDWEIIDSSSDQILPEWFTSSDQILPEWFTHQFNEAEIIRIEDFDVDDNWNGFAFGVAFEVNNHNVMSGTIDLSSFSRPHPFYLSFESEFTEECFDMPLSLELNKIDGSKYLWIIYISREHCHFVKTGARITFKARPGLMIKKWGLRMVVKKDVYAEELPFVINNVKESSLCPEIHLPYNWLVTNEENRGAKGKENYLSNLGLHLGIESTQHLPQALRSDPVAVKSDHFTVKVKPQEVNKGLVVEKIFSSMA